MHLQTKRLLIRTIEPSDVLPLAQLWSDPEVTRYMGGPRSYNKLLLTFNEEAQSGQPDPFDLWPVIEQETGNVVGHCGLLEKPVEYQLEIELVYVIAASVWGKGYATEAALALRDYAFNMLGVVQLIALIDPANGASAGVAEKVGFSFDREIVRPGGKVMRVYVKRNSAKSQKTVHR